MSEPVNTRSGNSALPITRVVSGNHSRGEVVPSPETQPQTKTAASVPNTGTNTSPAPHTATPKGVGSAVSQKADSKVQVPSSSIATDRNPQIKVEAQGLRAAVIQFSSKIDQITLNGSNYNIDFSSYSSRRTALKAMSYLVNTSQEFSHLQNSIVQKSQVQTALAQQTLAHKIQPQNPATESAVTSKGTDSFTAQLISLGKTISTSLPDGLKNLIQQNGINLNQLKQLSSRSQGYPLPTAQFDGKALTLSNGLSLPLPQVSLSSLIKAQASPTQGTTPRLDVIPGITYQNQQWVLKLTPIIETSIVELTSNLRSQPSSRNIGEMESQLVLAKPELSKLYSSLIKVLEKLPYKDSNGLPPASSNVPGTKLSPTGVLAEANSTVGSTKTSASINPEALAKSLSHTLTNASESKASGSQTDTGQSNKYQANQNQTNQDLTSKGLNIPDSVKGVIEEIKRQSPKQQSPELQSPNQKSEFVSPGTGKQEKEAPSSGLNRDLMLSALNKAFGKAGGLPQMTEKAAEPQKSLATLLFKLLPQIQPSMLRTLALPSKVQEELAGLLHLHSFAEVNAVARASMSHMNSVSLLFQLLLGVKTTGLAGKPGSGNSAKLSASSQKYLQKLQAQLGVTPSLLSMFDKAGTTETMAKLVNNLNLYSQASNDNNGQTNWYFTLPYSLNQHQDQLEGQFTKEEANQEDDPDSNWRLQLKFNLAQGPLLIKTHIKANRLEMTFNGEDDTLLNKIDLLLPPLMEKLVDIGLTPDKVVTKRTKVPATLLPGDHYLVKIKA
ncbi:conserved hypothetical protein [Shewanella sediminis HAW-EB3]|uniref:Uncharacterized protein n=1 Tax=Shewanella sediminis (strain HAW-EB3) TaxID=425104 RepID=A8FXR9_SHESH|nr:hypothetical protein [Shewanella sediminis]ABV37642.1 conserved hypothetical protein [Shewanella sediminis HAW-EB3]